DPRLAAAGRDEPQRGGGGVVLVAIRVGPRGGEVEVAVGGERRAGLALAAAGQPVRLLPTGGVDLPQGRRVAGALAVEGRHRRDQPGAVGGQGQAGQTRHRHVVVEVVEDGRGGPGLGRGCGHVLCDITPPRRCRSVGGTAYPLECPDAPGALHLPDEKERTPVTTSSPLFRLETDAARQPQPAPLLMVALDGFLDAGQVRSTLAEHLLEHLDHEVVASFEADELVDSRSRRPLMTFDSDQYADYDDPSLVL